MSTVNYDLERMEPSSNYAELLETFKHAKCPVVRKIQGQIRKAERRNQIYTNILLAYSQPNKHSGRRMSCAALGGLLLVVLVVAFCVGVQIGVKMTRPKPPPSIYNTLFGVKPQRSRIF
ncbi:uncharacterized protein [Bemisia tabaci]